MYHIKAAKLEDAYFGIKELAPGNKLVYSSKEGYSFDGYVGKYTVEEYVDRQEYAYVKWRNFQYGDLVVLLSGDRTSHAILYCAKKNFTFHANWRSFYLYNPKRPEDCLFSWYAGPDNYNHIWNDLNEV